MELPALNQRVKDLINEFATGNVSKFSDSIGHAPQKINRLFNVDSRSGKYPEPSLDIVVSITNKYSTIESKWLNTGEGKKYKLPESTHEIIGNTVSGEAEQRYLRIKYLEDKIEEFKEIIKELKKENKELTEIAAVLRYQLEQILKNQTI